MGEEGEQTMDERGLHGGGNMLGAMRKAHLVATC